MALSDPPNRPNPPNAFEAWAAAARALLALGEAERAAVLELIREIYAPLRRLGTVHLLAAAYQRRLEDSQLRERAVLLLPQTDPSRAVRLARDAAYYRRWRELLEGRP